MTELIKTRKQYEETLDFLKINRFAYDEANEIDDLIEALREVAKANRAFFPDAKDKWDFVDPAPPEWFALQDALDALPDWVKENG